MLTNEGPSRTASLEHLTLGSKQGLPGGQSGLICSTLRAAVVFRAAAVYIPCLLAERLLQNGASVPNSTLLSCLAHACHRHLHAAAEMLPDVRCGDMHVEVACMSHLLTHCRAGATPATVECPPAGTAILIWI